VRRSKFKDERFFSDEFPLRNHTLLTQRETLLE
jgi:hypothetical protein